jgi:hypothetical protein
MMAWLPAAGASERGALPGELHGFLIRFFLYLINYTL